MSGPIAYDADAEHPHVLAFQWVRGGAPDEPYHEATGVCPVCGCGMTKRWAYGQSVVRKGGFLGRRREPDAGEPWYTSCTCRTLHLGRPREEESGCGAWLTLAPPGPGQGGGAS
ncbi:hypothetical protein [Streptomyces boluensis]|uniref:Uncharacterized protein n=1 Tax=Streptomyces boluensis TaxID=1775135 RepID=A0A964UTS5_9ACTN|nr:hypothetical protein [Streptomyces boluensis]NBE55211.1 hypothetical protein [Streptomyces boluensis]